MSKTTSDATPKFSSSRDEFKVISKIASRAVHLAINLGVKYDMQSAMMDIEACHSNGNPLRLDDLLVADDGNFGHDVFGIRKYIDRSSGKLTNCFVPRFSK